MIIEKLQETHKQLIKNFSYVEDNSSLASINSKLIRRVRLHSKEMDNFLLNEALSEQSLGNNDSPITRRYALKNSRLCFTVRRRNSSRTSRTSKRGTSLLYSSGTKNCPPRC